MSDDIVKRLERWTEHNPADLIKESDLQLSLMVDLRDATGTIKTLRNDDKPWLNANYDFIVHDFRIWVEPIKKEFWDERAKTMVEREAFAIRARPDRTSGFFAYAYKHERDAAQVARNIAKNFDVQTYRVNFTCDLNPVGYRENIIYRSSIEENEEE